MFKKFILTLKVIVVVAISTGGAAFSADDQDLYKGMAECRNRYISIGLERPERRPDPELWGREHDMYCENCKYGREILLQRRLALEEARHRAYEKEMLMQEIMKRKLAEMASPPEKKGNM